MAPTSVQVDLRVELHLHTCYSFLDGASQPEEIAARAASLGYTALAITDHNGLHGAMAFAHACAAFSIQPITGVELTLRHGLHALAEPVHVTLLAETERGYANLCRLISAAHQSSPRHEVTLDPAALAAHTEGLIALSGCREGEAARLVDADRFDDALLAVQRLAELFGPQNTFVELQHNLVQGDTRRLDRLAEVARCLSLPVVATGNVHYHDRARSRLQDALVAVKNRTTLEASHRVRRPNSEFYVRPPAEIARLFARHPQALATTELIGQRCRAFNLANKRDLGYDFPDFTRQSGEQHASADEVLASYCWVRFDERYAPTSTPPDLLDKARKQLVAELRLVARHHLAGFFLIYRDLQQEATLVARDVRGAGSVRGSAHLPPGRGRGSSVSSIICYLIGLSHVDPVKNKLFFRRFLNEDLQAVPDIDLDFARDIREQLILRVFERYGHDHAALVCAFATYHLRSAVRDMGKVLGLPPAAIDKLARLSEGGHAGTIRSELSRLPEFQGQADGPIWQYLVDLVEEVAGFPRHVGQHVGGMIISSRPVIELVPVQPAAMEGRFICQWDKDGCDDARFIKIDFLALGMLSLVEECLELIWQRRGEQVDCAAIAYDDPVVYDAICRGDTVGLFQIESRAQIQMLTRTQPRTLDDLAVQVAIVRPGPIVGGAVNPYVRRREQLRRNPQYQAHADHPLLDDLLRDTLGVVLYQDQVLEVAITMGGFTPGQADYFRRSMSRRRSREAMESFRASFIEGAGQKGIDERCADAIFEKLRGFSEFGFPKSHAYAFAVLAYQSAWLREYYLEEYFCALLNNQPMGFYAPHVLVGDVKRHGVHVLRVAINRSGVGCVPGEKQILLGLMTVKGVSRELAEMLVSERDQNGPYRSLRDLLRRASLPRVVAERLIAVGALSEFGLSRRELLWQLGLLLPHGVPLSETGTTARAGRQLALALPIEQDMVELADLDDWERMVLDYGLLRLSPNYHPLALLRARLPENLLTATQLRAARDGQRVSSAGLVVCRQRPGTAKGFVFLLLEDETGLVNVVVRPDLYEAERSTIRGESYLCVEGVVQLQSDTLNLIASRVTPLNRHVRSTLPATRPRDLDAANLCAKCSAPPRTPAPAAPTTPTLAQVTPHGHDFR